MNPPRIAETPGVMRTTGWADYALLDSGGGRKLERYGPYRVVRPEPQAMWTPRLPPADWDTADAVFDPTDEDEAGNWRFRERPQESWPLSWGASIGATASTRRSRLRGIQSALPR